ncbi:MAG: hypothetical protein QNJ54_26695 [Prochloraceae cyanobacterium]|nr:hypothetical protein [Prochloraceae cyanobacterium]
MNSEERKARFIKLLEELLVEHGGIQIRLAEKLQISSARLSSWFQRKIDPTNLETGIFERIASLKGYSTEELARVLGFPDANQFPSNKFKDLIIELLSHQTQEQLGITLGVKQGAISNWINPEKNIDPSKIAAATMFAIARKKGWKFDDLLIYLGLKEKSQQKNLTNRNPRTICIILEKEDLAIASNYTGNLSLHFQIRPENITIATPHSLPQSLSVFDVLLFDLNNQQSPCIPLIESLQFDGDVVAFVDRSLPEDIQDRLKEKVTEVIVKPVPWSELKQKAYFE